MPGEPLVTAKLPFGIELPVSRRTASLLVALVVAAGVIVGWPYLERITGAGEPEGVVLSAAEVAQIREAQLHFAEEPDETFTGADGRAVVRHYASDDCLLVAQFPSSPDRTPRSTWMLSADRAGSAPPIGPLILSRMVSASLTPPAYAGGPPCAQGRCLNPHPGDFRSWPEETADSCWLRVWREWPDGCRHFQAFNRCGNFWDSNSDGTPRVTWICCAH